MTLAKNSDTAIGKNNSLKSRNALLKRLRVVELHLDEDRETFEEFERRMIRDLAPNSTYAQALAQELISLCWEINRTRRLRETTLSRAYDEKLHKTAEWVEHHYGSIDKYREQVVGAEASQEQAWKVALGSIGLTPKEVSVDLYHNDTALRELVDTMDRKIADLELRRRRLSGDYEKVWARYHRRQKART